MTRHTLIEGDMRKGMKLIPDESVHLAISSPPYLQQRDYDGQEDQIGQEETLDIHVSTIVEYSRDVWRVLRPDGLYFLNFGDKYADSGMGPTGENGIGDQGKRQGFTDRKMKIPDGMKSKDLMGIPWLVAAALRADGWTWRTWFPWIKRACLSGGTWLYAKTQKGVMPITVKDLVRLNPATVKLWDGEKWNQVTGFYEQEITTRDDLFELELRSGERINCTGDHRWPTRRGVVKANSLRTGDIIKTCILPEPQKKSPGALPASEIGWLCGLYLAEGHKSKEILIFSGHKKETKERYTRLKNIVEAYQGTIFIKPPDGDAQWIGIGGKALNGIIDQYIHGSGSKYKHLTRKAWDRDNRFLSALLLGYLEGDGHFDTCNQRWRLGFAKNEQFAIDLRAICGRLGIEISLRRTKVSAEKGGKKHDIFRGEIRFGRKPECQIPNTFRPKIKSEIVNIRKSRARKVWDISLKDEPHLFALSSGVLSHNSMPESAGDRPGSALEIIHMFTKSGSTQYWTHPELPAVRVKPEPDYRWRNRDTGEIVNIAPADWETLLSESDPKKRLWARRNLWEGHDYFWDPEAIRVPQSGTAHNRGNNTRKKIGAEGSGIRANQSFFESIPDTEVPGGRNRRNTDWFFDSWADYLAREIIGEYQGLILGEDGLPLALVVNPDRFKGDHFAVFPENLVRPLVLGGSSEKGCCPKCGAPWVRIVEEGDPDLEWRMHSGSDAAGGYDGVSWKYEKLVHGKTGHFHNREKTEKQNRVGKRTYEGFNERCQQNAADVKRRVLDGMNKKESHWVPSCDCNAGDPVPCLVLDPFLGRGTTARVSRDLGRSSVGCELSPKYIAAMKKWMNVPQQELGTGLTVAEYEFVKVPE